MTKQPKKPMQPKKVKAPKTPKPVKPTKGASQTEDGHIYTTLMYHWYGEIDKGTKRVEFREDKPYWRERLLGRKVPLKLITFSRGYTSTRMTWTVLGVYRLKIETDEKTKTQTFTEFPLEKHVPGTVFAIHLGERVG